MASFFRSVLMAFSMFSRFPVPRISWEEKNQRYILAALPLVGCAIGFILWGWIWLCLQLALGPLLYACGLALLPVAVSGGIHLDGFADTIDALASHAPPEKKQEILKDPHIGTFAAIALTAYLLLYTALCSQLAPAPGTALALGLMLTASRAVGALGSVCLPSSHGNGLLDTFRLSGGRLSIVIVGGWLAATATGLIGLFGVAGGAAVATAALCYGYLARTCRQFGGISGDLAGFSIQICELAMLAAFVLIGKVVSV